MATHPTQLKAILARKDATIIPGAPNALFARVIEDLGYECVYVTGAGIANMHLGAPDIGLVTLSELVEHVHAIADAVDVPLMVDGDTGFGNPLNTMRTVSMIERAGGAGIQIEDQVFPKKCGHFSGKSVIPVSEMVAKIKAAVDARNDPDFQIIARTDVLATDGINAALDRAHAYIEAGADATFVEAPVDVAQMARIARELPVPQIANIVHGGKTPSLPQSKLAEMGFAGTLYANAALQGALKAAQEVLGALRQDGSLGEVTGRLASFEERQRAVAKPRFDAAEERYRHDIGEAPPDQIARPRTRSVDAATNRQPTGSATNSNAKSLVARLKEALPQVDLDVEDLDLYRTDIFYESEHAPLAVARPHSLACVQAIARAVAELDMSLSTRGAGLSYSGGYIPADDRTLLVDMRGLERVVEINERDRYATVEAGVTWAQLHKALAGTGLTTPFRGTYSGRHATIGATLSQGAKLYGSGNGGTSAETTLSVTVVTGTGDVVRTGSAGGTLCASPFFRPYGPDLTGLFLGDCGALGIKVEASLQLVPAAQAFETAAFSFEDPLCLMEAMAQIGAQMLASECFGIDPATVRARMGRATPGEDLRALHAVARSGTSTLKGVRDAAMMAMRGRRFAGDTGYLLNCVSEGRSEREARARMKEIVRIAKTHNGRPTAASLPRMMRADPFPAISGLLSRSGRRIHWMHTVLPNSRGSDGFRATEAVFKVHKDSMERFRITRGYLVSANGPSCVGVETLVHWPDAPYPVHRHYLNDIAGLTITENPENLEARAAVKAICDDLVEVWAELGGAHLQIGRKYPYYQTRQAPVQTLLDGLKAVTDPHGIINPGSVLPATGRRSEGEQS